MTWQMPDSMFRVFTPEEEALARQWARDNHKPGGRINPTWHPTVRDECRKIDRERGVAWTPYNNLRESQVKAFLDMAKQALAWWEDDFRAGLDGAKPGHGTYVHAMAILDALGALGFVYGEECFDSISALRKGIGELQEVYDAKVSRRVMRQYRRTP